MTKEPIPHLPLGLTVRLRDSRLAIVMNKPFLVCECQLHILNGPGIAEVPAICPHCLSSTWYWDRDLLPMCRICAPPSEDWQFNLVSRAIAAMGTLDEGLAREGKNWMERAFISGDVDALQRIEGLQLVQKELRPRYPRYFEARS